MVQALQWVGDGFRAVVGMVIVLIPGIVLWLVVIGFIAIVQRWNLNSLYQIVQNRIWTSLTAVARKIAATVSVR